MKRSFCTMTAALRDSGVAGIRASSPLLLLLLLSPFVACSNGGPVGPDVEPRSHVLAPAASGDLVRQFVPAEGDECFIATIGLAFDGTNLWFSCLGTNVLTIVSPEDGTLVGQLTVPAATSLGALAWDPTQDMLWACDNLSQVILVDPSDGSSTSVFTAVVTGGQGGGCLDGLAFDDSDDTLWTSADISDRLNHYQTDGTLIAFFTGLSAALDGVGNSGIAVGGETLFLANGRGKIYTADKAVTSIDLFAEVDASVENPHLEDMECDGVTFAPDFAVVWIIDAFSHVVSAWEAPAGTCPFEGDGNGEEPTEVDIDIKPGSSLNPINPRSKGVTPVAILGSATFDVGDIDVSTIVFGPSEVSPAHHHHGEDVNGDGFEDLVVHFPTADLGLAFGDVEACLSGETEDGQVFEGCDSVLVLGGF